MSLLAWRLDVAHVDPLSTVVYTSGGNAKFRAGKLVTLRAISGHRDTGPSECPGNGAYALLPALAKRVAPTGLPKLYSPTVTGALGGADPLPGAALLGARLDGDDRRRERDRSSRRAAAPARSSTGRGARPVRRKGAVHLDDRRARDRASPRARSASRRPPPPPPLLADEPRRDADRDHARRRRHRRHARRSASRSAAPALVTAQVLDASRRAARLTLLDEQRPAGQQLVRLGRAVAARRPLPAGRHREARHEERHQVGRRRRRPHAHGARRRSAPCDLAERRRRQRRD